MIAELALDGYCPKFFWPGRAPPAQKIGIDTLRIEPSLIAWPPGRLVQRGRSQASGG
jgi:hypothetical protein